MVESPIVPTEILQCSKKKNVIFEEIITPRFVSIFIFVFIVISVFTSAVKMTMKTMKPVR